MNEKQDQEKTSGVSRREFISALGATVASSAFLAGFAKAGSGTILYRDSFGNVVPASLDAIALGVYPPPISPPVSSQTANNSGHNSGGQDLGGSSPGGYVPPNILLLMVDQLRAPRWLPNGGQFAIDNITPNLSALRGCSFVFPNYFVAATACSPSRATLLTGLYTQQTCMFLTQGASDPQQPSLQPGFPTFAQALTGAGYNVYWMGKWHLSDPAPSSPSAGPEGPSDYSFTISPGDLGDMPEPNINYPWDHTVASPDGIGNLGTQGLNPNGRPVSLDAAPPWLSSGGMVVTNDAFTADFFVRTWLPNVPAASPWCTTVSFVNPHDITAFPYAYGLIPPNFPYPKPQPDSSSQFAAFPQPNPAGVPNGNPDLALPALIALYDQPCPADWNVSDNPYGQPYDDGVGKPGLQAIFQQHINNSYGAIAPTADYANWLTFLNYYFWMQSCVDVHIGRVIDALKTSPFWNNTAIIFTSDHGDYGGSHAMKAKGGALYDEVINVPLYISFPGIMRANHPLPPNRTIPPRPFVCSSVDIFPYLYALALGCETWRSPGAPYSYLAGRESIADAIHSRNPVQRRVSCIPNYNGLGYQPYILHSTDEISTANDANSNPIPSHALAFRTVDLTLSPQTPYGGGKLGMYSYWPIAQCICSQQGSPGLTDTTTQPDLAMGQQFEFYNYTGNSNGAANPGEIGNSWVTDAALAGQFQSGFNNIAPTELYTLFPNYTGGIDLQTPYNAAMAALLTFFAANQNAERFQAGAD